MTLNRILHDAPRDRIVAYDRSPDREYLLIPAVLQFLYNKYIYLPESGTTISD